jgi:hypothetical protein
MREWTPAAGGVLQTGAALEGGDQRVDPESWAAPDDRRHP